MKPTYNFLIILTLMLLSNISYSQSVPSYVPTNGLVGWWGFNGNAQDGSGNGNHGTVNGAALTTDRHSNANSAFLFDGSNSWISIPHNSHFNFGNFKSISVWIYKLGISNLSCCASEIISKNRDSNLNSFTLRVHHGQGQPVTYNSFNLGGVSSLSIINDSQWYHLVITVENGEKKIFVNGVLESTNNSPNWNIGTNSSPILIGKQVGDGNPLHYYLWNGKIDDIGIWNRALTPQEITNLYNSQLPTQTSLCLPTITTSSPSSVGVDTVVIGGDISNDGGSSIVLRGICYSTSPNPNMGDQRTEDGSGIGSFNTVLRGLTPSTTYYARSYAKNSNGVVVYGNEVTFTTSSITIGSNYAGGIVFYVDGTGQHGLVCAPNDQGTLIWGCWGAIIPNTQLGVGTGFANTQLIVNGCSQRPIAASVCNDLVLNGYDDWYLPSRGELMLMYNNLRYYGLGNFSPFYYWTSSQSYGNPINTWTIAFDSGNSQTWYEGYTNVVRAIRSF